MFKVKATLIGFGGNVERYPCHFDYKIGDEIIFDGEKFIGRICLQLLPLLDKFVPPLFAAGPRYVNPNYYYPFFYSPLSRKDPGQKKYDGVGFQIVKENFVEPKYTLGSLKSPNAFKWPPHDKRDIARELIGRCDDLRTSALFKFEAFDVADKGDAIPYFRKEMVILDTVLTRPGIPVDEIRGEIAEVHLEEIYPGLGPVLLQALIEELESVGHLEIRDGKASVTASGEAKLAEFKAGLTAEEREALGM